jgi:hypothetical protein
MPPTTSTSRHCNPHSIADKLGFIDSFRHDATSAPSRSPQGAERWQMSWLGPYRVVATPLDANLVVPSPMHARQTQENGVSAASSSFANNTAELDFFSP